MTLVVTTEVRFSQPAIGLVHNLAVLGKSSSSQNLYTQQSDKSNRASIPKPVLKETRNKENSLVKINNAADINEAASGRSIQSKSISDVNKTNDSAYGLYTEKYAKVCSSINKYYSTFQAPYKNSNPGKVSG